MPKLTDMQIRAWIKSGERFEGRADGNGLYLRYREADKTPTWRFRYKLAGKSRAMLIGSYAELSLAKARETAKELSARVSLGYDVAGDKQERKAKALAKIEDDKNAMRVSQLAAEYFERQILPRWKHPDILRRRIDKDINPCIGQMRVAISDPQNRKYPSRAAAAAGENRSRQSAAGAGHAGLARSLVVVYAAGG